MQVTLVNLKFSEEKFSIEARQQTLSLSQKGNEMEGQPFDTYGEPRAARTHDPRLKRAMLYQLS